MSSASPGLAGLACLTTNAMPSGRVRRTNSLLSLALRFCGTFRLAHMLYSLARVSRRDRWRLD